MALPRVIFSSKIPLPLSQLLPSYTKVKYKIVDSILWPLSSLAYVDVLYQIIAIKCILVL